MPLPLMEALASSSSPISGGLQQGLQQVREPFGNKDLVAKKDLVKLQRFK